MWVSSRFLYTPPSSSRHTLLPFPAPDDAIKGLKVLDVVIATGVVLEKLPELIQLLLLLLCGKTNAQLQSVMAKASISPSAENPVLSFNQIQFR